MNKSKFSERLVELRQERKLTQNELTKQLGLGPMTISRWERGDRTPNIESLEILAKFFNVTAGYLIGMED